MHSTRGMDEGLPAALMTEFSALLSSRMGLHFPQERWPDLERGLRAAAVNLGYTNAETCVRSLLASSLGPDEMAVLADHLTIGETYFLRDLKVFEALEKMILPDFIKSRADRDRRLRIWSAACCTGEEPYSIAITLGKVLPNPEQWELTVLATDINTRFLAKADAGIFTRWSFRNVPAEWKNQYFREVSSKQFAILPRYRSMVTFSYLNLVEDAYPSLATNTNAMDVIFCRNVLMYFSAEQAKRVVRKLELSLVEGGWLITSPSETSHEVFAPLRQVAFPGALLYRKETSHVRPDILSRDTISLDEGAVGPFDAKSDLPLRDTPGQHIPRVASPLEANRPEPPELAALARSAADAGRLDEALEWCDKAIALDKAQSSYYYLRGTIQQERVQLEEAGLAFQRALYLNPRFVLAHFALGIVQRRAGRLKEARKSFDNATTLLAGLKPDELVPESTDITAGRLSEILKSMQQVNS